MRANDRFLRLTCAAALAAIAPLSTTPARADTYQVGPGKTYAELYDLPALMPGDIVEVDGDFTYGDVIFYDSGTEDMPITITGIPVNGNRPRIDGGFNAVEFQGHHTIFEGFEITGGEARCIYHHGHEITIRDTVVHDCPQQGILGGDFETGSLTLDHVEVYACGDGTQDHQIYMATNEEDFPGAVFRMQHCWVHDGNGGNSVKSRAERNEIYYNWIEGGLYHEVELIGPDGSPDLYREDSDVACNVLRKTGGNAGFFVFRVGGDGTGETNGRYRFFHNTIIVSDDPDASAVWRLFDGLESIEMHNNVIVRDGSQTGVDLYRDAEASWVGGEVMIGQTNWILTGSVNVPSGWMGTLDGADPIFAARAWMPESTSPLVDAATTAPASPAGHEFPDPLTVCSFHPPIQTLEAPGAETPRPRVGPPDIGAFEFGEGPPAAGGAGGGAGGDGGSRTPTTNGSGGSSGGAGGSGASNGSGASASGSGASGGAASTGGGTQEDEGGCGCRASKGNDHAGLLAAALAIVFVARRRRRA